MRHIFWSRGKFKNPTHMKYIIDKNAMKISNLWFYYNNKFYFRGDTFRPTFARLGELRSHFPQVPFLLLTATCTKNILQHITSRIHLPNVKIFSASPDRYTYVTKLFIYAFIIQIRFKFMFCMLIIYPREQIMKYHSWFSNVRQNIYLEYKKADDIFEELKWLFEEIKEKGIEARKTLIYVR